MLKASNLNEEDVFRMEADIIFRKKVPFNLNHMAKMSIIFSLAIHNILFL